MKRRYVEACRLFSLCSSNRWFLLLFFFKRLFLGHSITPYLGWMICNIMINLDFGFGMCSAFQSAHWHIDFIKKCVKWCFIALVDTWLLNMYLWVSAHIVQNDQALVLTYHFTLYSPKGPFSDIFTSWFTSNFPSRRVFFFCFFGDVPIFMQWCNFLTIFPTVTTHGFSSETQRNHVSFTTV